MKLTIAFPTHNRSAYLRRAVESVVSQLGDLSGDVAVTLRIYDNASSDDTAAACAALVAREPRLKVVRHPDNIGGDANILNALQSAEGDYVWVFGDDDYLRAGTLAPVCRLLSTREFDAVKLGSVEERDSHRSGVVPAGVIDGFAAGEDFAVERFRSADDILGRFGMGMGNFSSIIFSCDFFRSFHRLAEIEYLRSGYSHLEWIYRGLLDRPRAFASVSDTALVLRIEISPRDVSADRVYFGLNILRERLLEFGYSAAAVDTFFVRQRDAILLGKVKSKKIAGASMWPELKKSLRGLSNARQRMKLIVIAVMPSRLYRKLWVRL